MVLTLLLQEAPAKELLTVPGSKVTLALVPLPGDGTLHPFAIGAHE